MNIKRLVQSIGGNVTPPDGFIKEDPNSLVARLFSLAITLVVVSAVGYVIYSGYKFVIAQGDPGKIKEAQNTLTYAIIGMVVAIVAGLLTGFIYKAVTGQSLPAIPF